MNYKILFTFKNVLHFNYNDFTFHVQLLAKLIQNPYAFITSDVTENLVASLMDIILRGPYEGGIEATSFESIETLSKQSCSYPTTVVINPRVYKQRKTEKNFRSK